MVGVPDVERTDRNMAFPEVLWYTVPTTRLPESSPESVKVPEFMGYSFQ
jgi:hypothetical protein